ncbi:MAG: hypothetical protein IJO74_00240 [Clostridia bacterium]|nr:hypothetical protein [Clostridia bacterium]
MIPINEIHICEISDGKLFVPEETGVCDGKYIIIPGARCCFGLYSEQEFENFMQNKCNVPEKYRNSVMRCILKYNNYSESKNGKIPLSWVLLEHACGEKFVTVEIFI